MTEPNAAWSTPQPSLLPVTGVVTIPLLPAQIVSLAGGLLVVIGAWLGIACIVAALTRAIAMLSLPAGVAALALAVWCALRLRNFVDNLGGFGPSFGEALGFGTIVVAVGGIVAAVGLTKRAPAAASS